MGEGVLFKFNTKIEVITGSRKFRTKAQWPVMVYYTMDGDDITITKIDWDKCNGQIVDITDFIMPQQKDYLAKEICDLFWKKEVDVPVDEI